jgi:hypothetical protein
VRALLALAALLTLALPAAAAEVVSERPDRVAVVLYQEHPSFRSELDFDDGEDLFGGDPGLAVISETRSLDLPAGRIRISFRGVADGMVPQTAAIEGVDGRLIERNYDFDLLSPGTLLDKAVGAPARLVRTNRKTGEVSEEPVTIASGPDGIVLRRPDGAAEALGCSGLPEKLVFDQAPAGLTATPTLSADVETAQAGHYVVKLTYLATGLRWKADYVARLRPDGRTLDLEGWLTLSNVSGTTFGDAPTQVVAGRLALSGDDDPVAPIVRQATKSCWPTAPRLRRSADAEARSTVSYSPIATVASNELQEVIVTGSRVIAGVLGDYKLYTLAEPTTVAANQTKQVAFLTQPAVPYRRAYAYRAQPEYQNEPDQVMPVPVVLRLQNKADAGLGKPLPGGMITVLEPKPDGSPSLVGQARLRDTPVGLPAELEIGGSGLMTVEAVQGPLTEVQRKDRQVDRSEVTLTVRNAGAQPAPVEIRLDQSTLKLLSESRPHARDNAFALWTLQVPAEGEATLTYRTEQR